MSVRLLEPSEEDGTLRVPVDGITAVYLTQAYRQLVWAQDNVSTILAFLCREKHLEPANVVGFDDERGELIVRP